MSFSFATTITVPHALPDPNTALLEQLLQDGFFRQDLRLPAMSEHDFSQIVGDAKNFVREIEVAPLAWPVRGERWLNRLSASLTGKIFTELTSPQRFAIAHAAVTLGERPDLLN